MAVSAVYPYKYADILPIEISRNCLITGSAEEGARTQITVVSKRVAAENAN